MKKRILSAALALLLLANLPLTALAEEYDLADGSIKVSASDDGSQYVSQTGVVSNEKQTTATVIFQTGSDATTTTNTVTITAAENQTANVTLKDVNIDVRGIAGSAAVSTSGEGDVTIELEGKNTVRSGYTRAGLEKNNTGSLTITDANNDSGSLDATGGEGGAGVGGGYHGSGSDITISGVEVNATGGHYAAGIGGGDNGSGSNITITDSDVTAEGGFGGAGIGGGESGNGSNITISGGTTKAAGGLAGAGIGGGYGGSGSEITISGSTTNAAGGDGGAGIGGGTYGSGSEITISGSTTNAAGGDGGAGVGGGVNGSGSDITISGGTTNAAGGIAGAGIGGGTYGSGSDITVSGDAQLKVQGGSPLVEVGEGAPIGNGGTWDAEHYPMDGEDVAPDVSELTPEGKIEYYEPSADMEKDTPIEDKTVIGEHVHEWDKGVVTKEPTCTETGVRIDTCISDETKSFTRTVELPLLEHEFKDYVSDNNASYTKDGTKTAKCVWYDQCGKTHTVQDEGSRLIRSETAPLYRVTDADGRGVNYKAERKDGVLTVTVDADFAVLTGKLSGISALKVQGVEKIIFVTKGATSTFATADLLKQGAWGETYCLTHDGSTITFTLGEPPIDVSGILEKT